MNLQNGHFLIYRFTHTITKRLKWYRTVSQIAKKYPPSHSINCLSWKSLTSSGHTLQLCIVSSVLVYPLGSSWANETFGQTNGQMNEQGNSCIPLGRNSKPNMMYRQIAASILTVKYDSFLKKWKINIKRISPEQIQFQSNLKLIENRKNTK